MSFPSSYYKYIIKKTVVIYYFLTLVTCVPQYSHTVASAGMLALQLGAILVLCSCCSFRRVLITSWTKSNVSCVLLNPVNTLLNTININPNATSEIIIIGIKINDVSEFNSKLDNSFWTYIGVARDEKYIKKNEGDYIESLYNSNLERVFENIYDDLDLFEDFCIVEIDEKIYVYSYDEEKVIDMAFNGWNYVKDGILLYKWNSDSTFNYYYFEYKK